MRLPYRPPPVALRVVVDLAAVAAAGLAPSFTFLYVDARRRRLRLEESIVANRDQETLQAGHDEQAYAQVYWAHACLEQAYASLGSLLVMVVGLTYFMLRAPDVTSRIIGSLTGALALGILMVLWRERKAAGAIRALMRQSNDQLPRGLQKKVLPPRLGTG